MLGSLLLQYLWRGGAHALQTKPFSRFVQPCWVELDLFYGLGDFNLRKVGFSCPKRSLFSDTIEKVSSYDKLK